MNKREVLITGANGEVGHGLINRLAETADVNIIALDINPLDRSLQPKCSAFYQGDILDGALTAKLKNSHLFDTIFHLAGILSTGAEKDPFCAHNLNVNGAMNFFNLACEQSSVLGKPVTVVFPSTIAVYGLPDKNTKKANGNVTEDQFLNPITMYGINKLYLERIGIYLSEHFKLLDDDVSGRIDFRSIRFPGIISVDTLPTSGTSDYCPEMLHAAAKDIPYCCFVRPDATIPFMVMPDAIKSIIQLAKTPKRELTARVYNVTSFSLSAQEIKDEIIKYFPNAKISFEAGTKRQQIVDSWPADIDDSKARKDWGWKPDYDLKAAFEDYLIPGVIKRYKNSQNCRCVNL